MPSHSIGIMFHGTTSGKAQSTNPQTARRPGDKSSLAVRMPKGICMPKAKVENKRLRPSDAQKRSL